MRNYVKCILVCLFAFPVLAQAQSQSTKELRKQREEIYKASKSDLNTKATKTARKEAKKLQKEGWTTAPGALPLEKQLDKAYLMQMEYDDNMYPKYIMGEGMSVGENYDAAKNSAVELAKQNLAAQIQTEMTALVENTVSNKQLGAEQAASITESVTASKGLISQSIGRFIPVVECYKTNSSNNKEVLVRIAYNGEMAKEIAKQAIRNDLEKKGQDLHNELDQILGTTSK